MNLKMTMMALVAVLSFSAATVASAQAMSIPTTHPTDPGCTSDCGGDGDGDDGDPFDPFCMFSPCKDQPGEPCKVDCAPGIPGGGIPGNKAGLTLCDAQIGDLKKVTARQIKGISGRDDVQVVAVCADKNLIEQQLGVENIRSAIAQNDNMDAALGQNGYGADDVVGLIVGRTQAVLYVHAL